MQRAFLVMGCLVAAACASATRGSRCAPIDPELYLDYGGLYDECTVDRAARLVFRPTLEVNHRPPQNVVCAFAEFRVIVDTTGKAIPETIQVGRTNDAQYVELVLANLGQFRFAPGRMKDGRAVHQITRFESRTQVRLPVSIQGQTTRTSSAAC